MHINPKNEYEAEKRAAEQFKPIRQADWFKIPFKDAVLNQFLEEMPKERKKTNECNSPLMQSHERQKDMNGDVYIREDDDHLCRD